MKRRKALAMFSAILIGALTGCSESAPQEMDISEPIVTESAVTGETAETETPAYIQEEENSPYIIVDEESKTLYSLYYFYKNRETVDLSVIGDIEGIEGIKIAPLEDWYELGGIIGFENMENIDNITRLHISGGTFEELSFLNFFTNLSDIEFVSCKLKDSSALAKMNNISRFAVNNCEIDNADFLRNMPKLRRVRFENTDVEKIPELTIINDPDENIYVYDGNLYFEFINCGTIDISGLSSLRDYNSLIYRLDFGGSVIKDFSPLEGIEVYELFLNNTAGSDYSTMKGLSASRIWLDNCDLSDIGFLSYNKVGTLSLTDNNISDWSPLLEVEGLVWCWTFDNPVITPDNTDEYSDREIVLADSNKWAYPY